MAPKVIKATKFKTSLVNFSDNIRINKYGGKTVYANYDNSPLRIQLPKMKLPFGVSKYQNPDKPEEIKYSLELSFSNTPPEVLQQFLDLEDKIISFAEEKSKELFKKQQSKELLREFYKSFIKFTENENGERDDKYPPRLKTKIYTDGKSFLVDAYDSEKVNGSYPKLSVNEEDVDDVIQKGCECEAIVECTGIWVVNKSFGISWKLSQLKIHKNDNKLSGYAFEDEEQELGDFSSDIEEMNDMKLYEKQLESNKEQLDTEDELEEITMKVEEPKPKKSRKKREEILLGL